jgi:excisionase family DNA binding protein
MNLPDNIIRASIQPLPVRGLSRGEAARYVGIGTTKFDEMVRDGRMPKPKRIDGRTVWDLRQLDIAFDALPGDTSSEANSWD